MRLGAVICAISMRGGSDGRQDCTCFMFVAAGMSGPNTGLLLTHDDPARIVTVWRRSVDAM